MQHAAVWLMLLVQVEGLVVSTTTHLPVEGAKVSAMRLNDNTAHSSVAGADGRFHFDDLSPGEYFFWAIREGLYYAICLDFNHGLLI